jgi:hypothetical protein
MGRRFEATGSVFGDCGNKAGPQVLPACFHLHAGRLDRGGSCDCAQDDRLLRVPWRDWRVVVREWILRLRAG